MNTLEDRLREAYREAAETVRPEDVLPGGVHGRDRGRRTARRGDRIRSHSRLLIPLAAAAGVVAAVVTATAVVQAGQARPAGTHRAHPPVAAQAATPAYFVALNWTTNPSIVVVNAATGAVHGTVPVPFRATSHTGVTTADGRTFVVTEPTPGCRTVLYRFRLSASGTPGAVTRFATVRGYIATPWDVAVSGGGRVVAYDAHVCPLPSVHHEFPLKPSLGYLAVVSTATGQSRRWTFGDGTFSPFQGAGGVTLSADGRTVAFGGWVMPTSAPDGPLARYGRVVARAGQFGQTTSYGGETLAPDGRTVYFATFRVVRSKPTWKNWQLRALDLATGRYRLVRSFPGSTGSTGPVSIDPSGRYLMVEYVTFPPTTHISRYDLVTGRVTALNAGWTQEAAITW